MNELARLELRAPTAGRVARREKVRSARNISVGVPDGKTELERPTRTYDDNIKIDLTEIGRGDVD